MTADEIDKLTIAEVRAIVERAGDALKTLRELGLAGPPPIARAFSPDGLRAPQPATTSPFPCSACGRTATERPGEPTQPEECLQCGNHLPLPAGSAGARMSNKGPLVMDADMVARRAALIAAPAFDEHGEPT